MGILLPIFAAGSLGIALAFNKLNLRRGGVGFRTLFAVDFLVMFGVVATAIAVLGVTLPPLSITAIGVLLALILVSFAQNVFELKGMQAMPMNVREPISDLGPLLTGVLAFFLFPSEGNVRYLIAIAIGVFVVMWANERELSFRKLFRGGAGYVFADMSLGAIGSVLIKLGVLMMPAAYIPLVRTGGVFLLALLFFPPHRKYPPHRGTVLGVASGILFGLSTLAYAYAVKGMGLNFTVLVMLLEPSVMYLMSFALLKERFRWKPIAGSVAIIGLIALALA